MPYRLHHRPKDACCSGYYVSYDQHTSCAECHRPRGLLRLLLLLNTLAGPRVRCRHHHHRHQQQHGWGGDVRGLARRKGCRNPEHYVLAFQPWAESDAAAARPDRLMGIRTRLPPRCRNRTHDTYGHRFHHHQHRRRRHKKPETEHDGNGGAVLLPVQGDDDIMDHDTWAAQPAQGTTPVYRKVTVESVGSSGSSGTTTSSSSSSSSSSSRSSRKKELTRLTGGGDEDIIVD
ncbi:hypothetical protein F4780DRAFT_780217 [Xylariomycetidae sp. FL0641]|nr:hypothetical protein F4780DRAFT_780217 [Xylariomycetidae sp. FL0641]